MRTLLPLTLLTAACLAACAPSTPPWLMFPSSEPSDAVFAPSTEDVAADEVASPAAPETPEQRAARLRAAAILVDGHDGVPPLLPGGAPDMASPGDEPTPAELARRKAAGITGGLFPIHVDPLPGQRQALHGGAARRALDRIDAAYRQIERHGAELTLARSARDLRRAKREGKIAALLGIEGGHAIENSLPALRSFYRLGVRTMTLTHTSTNDWADSAAGALDPAAARHRGLSPFGEEVVREMQRIGMLVDVSHASEATFRSVLKVAKAPVITASSVRGPAHDRRPLDDDLLRALASHGGIAVVSSWALFLDEAYAERAARIQQRHGVRLKEIGERYPDDPARLREEIARIEAQEGALKPPPLSRIADHIDHLVKVAGVDHVALGADLDGMAASPHGLAGIDGAPSMALELVRRGYSDEDILKILGGNFLRVLEQAEAYAASTQTALSGDGSTRQLTADELPSSLPELPAEEPRPLLPAPAPPRPAPRPPAPAPRPVKPAAPPDPGGLDLLLSR
ncbi:dipeptidase [Sorangium sp. So ce513]|uniref:dipeptidase n=1 Tax=Sorangium sp. So ce513 TaxID=3133315 RepID=UPI003F6418E4